MMYHEHPKKRTLLPVLCVTGQRVEHRAVLHSRRRRSHIRSLLGALALACALLALVGALPVAAAAGTLTKFKVPTPMSEPDGITTGPVGRVGSVFGKRGNTKYRLSERPSPMHRPVMRAQFIAPLHITRKDGEPDRIAIELLLH